MFEDRTTENLKKETLAEIEPATGVSSMAGSYADATVGPLCQAVSRLYKALPGVLSMLFVDESSGRFLDLVGGDYFDLTRREGTKARCSVTLTGKAGTVVNAGTVFLTAEGLEFVLLSAVTIGAAGTALGELEAAEVGSAYNIQPDSLTQMYVNLTGLESYKNSQGEGGTDRESDLALYTRIDEARKRPDTSGNGWDYRSWALEVPGVGEAKVVELPQGPGTVGVTVIDSNYQTAAEEILEAVRANIQAKRPVGPAVTVDTAGEVEITVSAAVTVSGTTPGAVQAELESRLKDYLAQLVRGKYQKIYYGPEEDGPYSLIYNRVLALLLSIEGVENFSALTVNGTTADVILQADQVPVLKEVSVT